MSTTVSMSTAARSADSARPARPVVLLFGLPEPARAVGRALAEVPGIRFAPIPTELFGEGLARFVGAFMIGQLPGPSQGSGPAVLFDHDMTKLDAELRLLADDLLGEVRADAEVLVEYSPGNAKYLDLVSRVYPDAVFVHATAPLRALVADALRRRRFREAIALVRQSNEIARSIRSSTVQLERVDVRRLAERPNRTLHPILRRLSIQGGARG